MKLPWQCIESDCESPKIGGLDVCDTHRRAQRKELRQLSKSIKVTRIKRVSDKHAKRLAEYNKLARKYKEMNPQCEVAFCRELAVDVHHIGCRDGIRLTDIELFMSVCRPHHDKIHSDPNWAKANGYLISKNGNQKTEM